MGSIAPEPTFLGNYVLFLAVRQLIVYLVWLLAAALAGAGACWCCGYGVRAVWTKAEEARQEWRAARGLHSPAQDSIAVEASRGISEIEEYLAVRSVALPRPEDEEP